tara:strand:- start:60085 stop:60975 length:891 start_codon:yes stop_codon:yes gene_type:complete
MKIQTLKALLRIHEAGSIRAAAQTLHISQPALTLAIQQLEEEVGAPLLTRTKRGVTFTAYGNSLLKHAQLIVSESQRINEEIAQMRGDWEGQIRLSSSPAISLSILPRALRPFMAKHPNIEVHCIDGVSPMINPALRSGALDFALTPVELNHIEPGLNAEPLCEREIVIATHKSNPLVNATSLAELQNARWVYATPRPGPGALIEKAFNAAGLNAPAPVMICESLLALPDLLADTSLVTTLPNIIFERAQQSHGLHAIPITDTLPTLEIAILRLENVPLTPAANELLSWVRFVSKN